MILYRYRRPPKKTLLGFTWVGWINFILLQWFFVRIGYTDGLGLMSEYGIFKFIVPLTGWWDCIPLISIPEFDYKWPVYWD